MKTIKILIGGLLLSSSLYANLPSSSELHNSSDKKMDYFEAHFSDNPEIFIIQKAEEFLIKSSSDVVNNEKDVKFKELFVDTDKKYSTDAQKAYENFLRNHAKFYNEKKLPNVVNPIATKNIKFAKVGEDGFLIKFETYSETEGVSMDGYPYDERVQATILELGGFFSKEEKSVGNPMGVKFTKLDVHPAQNSEYRW